MKPNFLPIKVFAVFVSLFLMLSCDKNGSVVKVEQVNFADEIQLQQNLNFTFNIDLVPDSLVNSWRKESYLIIEPKIDGSFKWVSKNELMFSPTSGFEPLTAYTATLHESLTQYSSIKKLGGDSTVFHFHTPDLLLNNLNLYWTRSNIAPHQPELKIVQQFNYPILSEDLKTKQTITSNNTKLNFDTHTNGFDANATISIVESNQSLDDQLLNITYEQGIACINPKYKSKKPIHYTSPIPSKDNFTILNAEALYEDTASLIKVYTNQQVLENQNLQQLVSVSPAVGNFNVSLQETGLVIKGNFTENQSYELLISNKLRGIFNGKLKSDFSQTLLFGAQKPSISFISKQGLYLTSKGAKEIAMRLINMPVVNVKLYKIYANNILSFLKSSGSIYNYYYDEEGGYESSIYLDDIESYGDLIYEKEINTASMRKHNGQAMLNLQFDEINDKNAIYAVEVRSPDDYWLKATKIVSISDIGLIVKESDNQLYVFAHSLLTAQPIADATITLVSRNNQEIISAQTNNEGICKFDNLKSATGKFIINMVTAHTNRDFTYLHFDQTRTENSRYDVGGARNNPSLYQAYIYGDREIYRPGETIFTNTIVRDEKYQPLANVPVKLKWILPNGKEYQSQKGLLNAEGAIQNSFIIPSVAITGTYTIEVYTANEILLTSKNISIEEFMPDRIKVSTFLNQEMYAINYAIKFNATAMNLFGTPASNRNYEVECTFSKIDFKSSEFENYHFALSGKQLGDAEAQLMKGTTDIEGKFAQSFEIPDQLNHTGLYQAKVFTSVFDESGRPVNQVKKAQVFTQNHFLGIKNGDTYLSTQEPCRFDLVALTAQQKKATGVKAIVEVIKYNWQTVLENDYGSYRYVSNRKEQIMEKKHMVINAQAQYSFVPTQSGEYEIRLSLPGAQSYVSKYFYAYGWGSTTNQSFEVNKEGSIEIICDKKVYQKGDKVNLLFKTPFAGKLIVTLERDKVFKYYTLQTDKRSANLSIEVENEYLPNVYITATVIKAVNDSKVPLTVGHGFVPLMVESPDHKIDVQINAVEKSISKTKQRIEIVTNRDENVELTLAAVDEGILQLKNTVSPNPYQYFFQKKALQVNSYDIYPKLLPEFRLLSTGGDGYNIGDRINPMSNKQVKPFAVWSGALRTNSSGKAYFDLEIPNFSGRVRLMAVAYKGHAFGAANKDMIIADPMVISTSLPRFLSPSDSAYINISLSNTTKETIKGNLSLTQKGNFLSFSDASFKSISIAPLSEVQVPVKLSAGLLTGVASLKTIFTSSQQNYTDENEIAIRPATTLIKQSISGVATPEQEARIPANTMFVKGTTQSKLLVSNSPMVQLAKNFDELFQYPYGCLEQTVSKAFPQLYLPQLVKLLHSGAKNATLANMHIQEAITKIQAMQLPNGALATWQGAYDENWWGSVYACHFLVEAQKNGYEVNTKMIDKLIQYQRYKLNQKATEVLYYSTESNQAKHKQIAAKEIFYSLYLMATMGKQDLALMNYYKSNQSLLALDSKYLLAITFKLLGDQASYSKLAPANFMTEKSNTALGGSYYSHIRDMALILSAMIDNEPNHPQISMLARHLSQELNKAPYLSTQQLAFSLMALSKLAKKEITSDAYGEVLLDHKKLADYKGAELIINNPSVSQNMSIQSKKGKLFYFYQNQGIPSSQIIKEEDSYLKVRRNYLNRNGQTIDQQSFKQNDLILVKITLETTDGSSADNVVICDILPAGFEVENPRITEQSETPWLSKQSIAQHQDIRDDRVILFTQAGKERKEFYYMLRAVSKGKYKLGPVTADAMYNGEYHSYHGAGVVEIK